MNFILKDKNIPCEGHNKFCWESLEGIRKGRENLGEEAPVLVYRLMQYTMLDILTKAYGKEKADNHFRQAGYLAGTEFAKNMLDLTVEYSLFFADLQKEMRELKIGILRIESFDRLSGEIMLTIMEDLDCSGIPVTNENICCYDEGFLSGILESYTGKKYNVREIDCWANGNRVCRFHGIAE